MAVTGTVTDTVTAVGVTAATGIGADKSSQTLDGISVIMPAYNAAHTIRRAVDSVLAQSYASIELIIIDDASADDTFSIASAYAAADPRVRVLRNQPNAGVATSRNRGVAEAAYPLVAFLDSDDLWDATKLERQVEVMTDAACGVCFTASRFVDDAGRASSYILRAPDRVTRRELLRQNVISCSSVLVRRADLLAHPMPDDPMLHEDYAVWLALLEQYPYAVGIDEPLLTYQVSANSKSGRKLRAARMQWNTYRHIRLAWGRRLLCMTAYAFRNIKKYMAIRTRMRSVQ